MTQKITYLLVLITLFNFASLFAQKKPFLDIDTFYGIAIAHDKSLKTAIQGNPFGMLIGYSIKNNQSSRWTSNYNFPDVGFSALYQNMNSDVLGKMYGLYGHYNFYLNNRNAINKLQFRFGLGLAYITNPYQKTTNPYNYTIATNFAGSAYLKLNYHRDFFHDKIGFQTGIALIHYSNASFKNPNLGLNTLVATVGLNYNLSDEVIVYPSVTTKNIEKRKVDYHIIFRTGINESKLPNSGQFPFYTATFLVSKKINYKASLTTGMDFFKTNFLNSYYQQKQELETGITTSEKFKTNRFGIFVGHQLKINRLSLITQVGYSVYSPNIYVTRIYERAGLQYKINNHFFTELTLKLNLFRAEGLEFGIGYKL